MAAKPAFSEFIAALRELSEDDPDTRQSCTYFQGPDPVCIVGQGLSKFGIHPLIEGLSPYDGHRNPGYAQGDLLTKDGAFFAKPNNFADQLPWELLFEPPTEVELMWVHTVQSLQDGGSTWGAAVADADEEIGVV